MVWWIVGALLASCNNDSSHFSATTALPHPKLPAPAKSGPTAAELTAGMVEAVTIGKSTVPVAVKFDLAARPILGQPLDIAIALLPQIEANSAAVQVSGSEGLKLAPGDGSTQIPSVDPTQAYRLKLTVTPTADGVHLLNLSVSLNHDDIAETRTFAIPVIVSPAADAAASAKR